MYDSSYMFCYLLDYNGSELHYNRVQRSREHMMEWLQRRSQEIRVWGSILTTGCFKQFLILHCFGPSSFNGYLVERKKSADMIDIIYSELSPEMRLRKSEFQYHRAVIVKTSPHIMAVIVF